MACAPTHNKQDLRKYPRNSKNASTCLGLGSGGLRLTDDIRLLFRLHLAGSRSAVSAVSASTQLLLAVKRLSQIAVSMQQLKRVGTLPQVREGMMGTGCAEKGKVKVKRAERVGLPVLV